MNSMKKSLLQTIQDIEQEAKMLVETAQNSGQTELDTINTNESRTLEDVRLKAEKRAHQVAQEKMRQTQDETQKIKEEAKQSVQAVHSAAKANHKATLSLVKKLFIETYSA